MSSFSTTHVKKSHLLHNLIFEDKIVASVVEVMCLTYLDRLISGGNIFDPPRNTFVLIFKFV